MGYTHYYSHSKTIPQDKWDAFLIEVKTVACRFKLKIPQSVQFIKGDDSIIHGDQGIEIGDGMGDGGQPDFTKSSICFNGVGDDAHETLGIDRDDTGGQFCKTAKKPYDLLCTATLVLYKHHFGDNVSVGSDGGPEGFQEGLDLVNDTLKTNIRLQDIYPSDEEED